MPSPFPGMDPWLEGGLFPDLHDVLITYLREALNAAMPRGYAAMGTTLVWTDPGKRREPDVTVSTRRPKPSRPRGVAVAELPGLRPAGAAAAPLDVPFEQKYLEIRATPGRRLVTAVEILSPANKRAGDAGRAAFQVKQAELARAGVNLVEIDLLRAGLHTTAVSRARLEELAGAFDYHVCVAVAGHPAELHVAGWPLADRLPAFGVPLDPGVSPVTVDLQPLLGRAYDTGRYADELVDYALACDPPLSPEQAAWAAEVLARRAAT